MAVITIPKPNIGDKFVRLDHQGWISRSMVVGLREHPESPMWEAVLFGVQEADGIRIDSHPNRIGDHDWRPADWVMHPGAGTYHPKGWVYSRARDMVLPASEVDGADILEPFKGEERDDWLVRAKAGLQGPVHHKKLEKLLNAAWEANQGKAFAA